MYKCKCKYFSISIKKGEKKHDGLVKPTGGGCKDVKKVENDLK
jgi:hypothetical protein